MSDKPETDPCQNEKCILFDKDAVMGINCLDGLNFPCRLHTADLAKPSGAINVVAEAVDTLRAAFKDDPDFAYSWHCNIAMASYDAIGGCMVYELKHKLCNDAASRFMKLAFGVDTKHLPSPPDKECGVSVKI